MNDNKIFSDILKIKFDDIGNKLYNFKYGFDLIFNYLENEEDISLNSICLLIILKKYFSEIKEDYNKLEEDLGVLI